MNIDSISLRSRPRRTALLALTFRPWQMLVNAITERQTYAELSRLDDYMLKDIGISRGNIQSAIRENRHNRW